MMEDTSNPYVGLRPYEADESLLFFGRNEQTLELLERLHQHHFVAVVGSSGSGKSSLLRAGLIPALKAGYLVNNSDHWVIAVMKPGQSPLYNLAESILQQVNPATDTATVTKLLQQIKEEGADALLNLITPLWKEQKINFFLLIDQFEELFRFAMDQKDSSKKSEAIDFVNIMLELAQQKVMPFYIVITMRSDFIGDCADFYGLPEAMNKSQYLVPRLNRVQLKTVIESPARLYGGKLNPSLTSLLLNELGKVKDELPLLQHALMRMWDFEENINKSGELDLEDYNSIGGIEKALSNHADEALAGMSETDLHTTKEIFQALTAIDENGRKIRRPVLLSQLKELTGATEEQILNIINLFIKDKRSFLIINKAGNTDDKVIDISHESLIRQWNALSEWVDEEGESASVYLQLAEASKLHKQNKKDFLTGSELQIALEWRDKFKPVAVWANRYKEGFEDCMDYLDASEKDWKKNLLKEKSGKRKQRILIISFVLLGVLLFGAFITISYVSNGKKYAEMAKNEAQIAMAEALKQKEQAAVSEKQALIQKRMADSSSMVAMQQMDIAQEQQALANVERMKAEKQTIEAQIAYRLAQQEKDEAEAEKEKALIEKEISDSLRQQAINMQVSAERDKDISDNSRQKVQDAYNLLIKEIDLLPPSDSITKKKFLAIKNDLEKAEVAIKIPGHSYSVEVLNQLFIIPNPEQFITGFNKVLDSSEINTPLRLAAYMAQVSFESANFTHLIENLNYSAAGLMNLWSTRFPDIETAKQYERNPQRIANRVYANRLGNGDEASGDGWKYRGRGYLSTTGKTNYEIASKLTGYDLINNPDQLGTIEVATAVSCLQWKMLNLNQIADEGASDAMVVKLTKKINGGTMGLQERISIFNKACKIFDIPKQ